MIIMIKIWTIHDQQWSGDMIPDFRMFVKIVNDNAECSIEYSFWYTYLCLVENQPTSDIGLVLCIGLIGFFIRYRREIGKKIPFLY